MYCQSRIASKEKRYSKYSTKNPKPQAAPDAYKLTEEDENTLPFHSSVFDRITPAAVHKAALRTNGSHGPSGLDANEWRTLLTNFDQSSVNLCGTIAEFARKLATVSVTSEHLVPYNACRLIPLEKQPGVRPIGVGEVLRRIIGRVILKCVSNDLQLLGGNSQLCLGQKRGIEHAIHSLSIV